MDAPNTLNRLVQSASRALLFLLLVAGPAFLSQAMDAQAIGPNGEFNCGYDWNGNGAKRDDAGDIVACLDAAKAAAGQRQDGSDAGVRVLLPEGRFDLASATQLPYVLVGGMNIRGVYPRLAFSAAGAPDGTMSLPDGGTWLFGGGNASVIFAGRELRGLTLENIGFARFQKALSVGGDGIDGMSFSVLRNLITSQAGSCNAPSCIAFELNNIQHVRIDHLKCSPITTCLDIINQNSRWQGANSVITDVSLTSAREGSRGGIILEVRKPSAGACQSLNYITLIRPQVTYGGSAKTPGTSNILLTVDPACPGGRPTGIGIHDADIEGGGAECGIRLEKAQNSFIDLAGTSTVRPRYLFCADRRSVANVWMSRSLNTTTHFDNKSNLFLGFADSSARTNMVGAFRDSSGQWRSPGFNGRPAKFGSLFWGNAQKLQPATGAQVCREQALACETSYNPGSAQAQSCHAVHGGRFFALCR